MLVLLAMSMMRTLMTRVNVQSLKFSLQRCCVSTVKPAHDSIHTAQWIEYRIHLTAYFFAFPQKLATPSLSSSPEVERGGHEFM